MMAPGGTYGDEQQVCALRPPNAAALGRPLSALSYLLAAVQTGTAPGRILHSGLSPVWPAHGRAEPPALSGLCRGAPADEIAAAEDAAVGAALGWLRAAGLYRAYDGR